MTSRMFRSRARLIESARAALDAIAVSRGTLLVLSGEAGIGKTFIADAVCDEARARGFHTSFARVWEGFAGRDAWPIAQLVQGLVDEGVALSPRERSVIGPLIDAPDVIPSRSDDASSTPLAEPLVARVVVQIVRRASRTVPRVLIFDDVHQADPMTLATLELLARSLRSTRVLVIVTQREVEARHDVERSRQLARIAREGATFELSRLPLDEVSALLREELTDADHDIARAVHQASEGNPLFVRELGRSLASRRISLARLVDSRPLAIDSVIDAHLSLASTTTRRILARAALFGRRFEIHALTSLVDEDAFEIDRALIEGERLGIVTREGGNASFTHILIRDVLEQQIALEERRRVHGAIAAALSAAARSDMRAIEIAYHFLESDADPRRIIEAAKRAARIAFSQLDFQRMFELYDRAIAHVPRLDDGARAHVELLIGCTEAKARMGALDEARAFARDATARARALGTVELQAEAALALAAHFHMMAHESAVGALLIDAIEDVGSATPALRARLLASLAATQHPSPGGTAALARDAVDLARSERDPSLLVEVLFDALISGWPYFMTRTEQEAIGEETRALGEAAGHMPAILRGTLTREIARIEQGHLDGVDERIAAIDVQLQRGGPRERALGGLVRSMVARLQGRFAESEAVLEQGVAQARADDVGGLIELGAFAIAFTRRNTEDIARLGDYLNIRMHPSGNVWSMAARGAHDAARVALSHHLPTGDFTAPALVFTLADAAVLANDGENAKRLARLVEPASGALLTFGPATALGPADLVLAGLARLRGNHHEARRFVERAVSQSERARALPFLVRALALRADLLDAVDSRRARADRDRAQQLATALGMTTIACDLAERLSVGDPPVLGTANFEASGPHLVVERRGDIVTLRLRDAVAVVKDSKGVRYLELLLHSPHRELHATELYALGAGPVELGDAGAVLDEEARHAYETRIADLEEIVAEAESFGDVERARLAHEELEALAEELARAFGKGGRARRAGSLTERARINVQRRLKAVIERAIEVDVTVGMHLSLCIRTGTFCCYAPAS